MTVTRIWFNRGFSLAPIAAAMRAADPGLEVHISVGKDMPQYAGPTTTWTEPSVATGDYVAWVRSQIVAGDIDIFIPTRQRQALASAGLPCRVELPAAADVLDVLEDKWAFAQAVAHEDFHLPTATVASSQELQQVLEAFAADHGDQAVACVKPRTGVNGHGFWKLTHNHPTSHLINPDNRNMRADLFIAALAAQEVDRPIDPLVVMEYLPGPEVSLDLLAHHGALLKAAVRTKLADGRQHIQTRHPLLAAAGRLVGQFGLHGVVNIQFRQARDKSWKILEINTRPAGGVVYGEGFGTRILADWAGLLTGRLTPQQIDHTPIDLHIAFDQIITRVAS